MAGNRRRTVAQGCWRRVCWVASFASVFVACRPPAPDTLAVVERIRLPQPSIASVHFHDPSGIWLGAPGELIRIDRNGMETARTPLGDPSVVRIVGELGESLLVQAGSTAGILDGRTGALLAERPDMAGAIGLDTRGRFVFRATGVGAVIVHDPLTLDPIRGWSAVGATTTAVAVVREGDRVLQATGGIAGDRSPTLLIRDFQTGRVLATLPIAEDMEAVVTGRDGSVFAIVGRGAVAGGVIRLGWRDGSLMPIWRRSFADLGVGGVDALGLSASGDRLALVATQNGAGLLVLDVETGRTLDRLRGDPIAVAFDADDRIFVLHPGELQRVEPADQ